MVMMMTAKLARHPARSRPPVLHGLGYRWMPIRQVSLQAAKANQAPSKVQLSRADPVNPARSGRVGQLEWLSWSDVDDNDNDDDDDDDDSDDNDDDDDDGDDD